MALAIDGSSPAVATNLAATVTTASFTPPAGSVLLVAWSGDSVVSVNPAQPTITDSLGAHLTYTLADWKSHADAPARDGQTAMWTAVVGSSAAMTVSVTNQAAAAPEGALKVYVLTGADTASPLGAHGKSGSASAASIAQAYTAQATSGQGFVVTCDWDLKGAQTAGTGCTRDASANLGTAITYGFLRRTTADDSNGVSNTLNVTLPGTSTNLAWCYAEIKPATVVASGTPQPLVVGTPGPRRAGSSTVSRNSLADDPVLTTAPPIVVGQPLRRAAPPTVIVSRSSTEDIAQPMTSATPPPVVVSYVARPALPGVIVSRSSFQDVPPGTQPVVVEQLARPGRGSAVVLRSSTEDEPVLTTRPPVVVEPVGLRPPPPVVIVSRSSLEDPPPPTTGPTTIPVVVTQPGRFGPGEAIVSRNSLADDPVLTTPAPVVVEPLRPPVYVPTVVISRGSLIDLATPAPIVVTAPARPRAGSAVVVRSSLADPVIVTQATPGPVVVTQPLRRHRPQVTILRGVGTDAVPTVITRPATGTVTRPTTGTTGRPDTGTTGRPDSGRIVRPYTGIVARP